ncbi:hypothetical protein ACFOLF_29870 [Paenibacillus sepulcri]|uniref:Uncharacterized protein n=1 Tax=Paenibacillus sepulcri TaxID=359917 RepID=A0ABS7CG86_9BACL|nr:hypothetical protein [Paenibacillus sepulcri]
MDFFNDESLTEYQEFLNKAGAGFGKMGNGIQSPPEYAAEIIYEAATDGTNQLRYIVGEDAKEVLKLRKELDDTAFNGHIAGIFS